jgi:CRP-like cAMP-binding protein
MPHRSHLITFIQRVFPMQPVQAERIAGHFRMKAWAKNDFMLLEGKTCNEYHYIEQGFVRAYTHDLEGNDVTTGFYSFDNVVCEIYSFFKRVPSGENLQALTSCTTWSIGFEELQQVFHSMPEFREFGRTTLVNAYAHLKQRMLSMLHQTAEERYADLLEKNADIFQYAALKHIATYLGVTDTSLSRIRKDFAKGHP